MHWIPRKSKKIPATRITTEGKNGQATEAFMRYLLEEEAQRALLNYGFRPANPKIDYTSDPKGSFFNNDIEVGDAPTSQQMLRDLWDIVGDDPKTQAVKFQRVWASPDFSPGSTVLAEFAALVRVAGLSSQ